MVKQLVETGDAAKVKQGGKLETGVSTLPDFEKDATFYCYGTYNSMAAAYNSEYGVSYEDAIKWQKAKNITMGISIGCGVLFAEELVRYLISANSVIPKQAKKIKPARMAKIRVAEERALQKRLEEEELLQEENEAQNEEENNVQTEQTDSEHKVSDSTK